jgi:hypothetical protein
MLMGALSSFALTIAFALNDLLNLPLERWYFAGDSIPHDVIIHAEVVMYQYDTGIQLTTVTYSTSLIIKGPM